MGLYSETPAEYVVNPKANDRQVAGEHYKTDSGLQHWDLVNMFQWDYFQSQVIKYLMRWRKKNGLEDLEKAKHYLEKYIEVERAKEETARHPEQSGVSR